MKRVALFLKDSQIRKAKALAKATQSSWASAVRGALDFYFEALRETKIKPHLQDGRVSRGYRKSRKNAV
jgi:hypothetical protein